MNQHYFEVCFETGENVEETWDAILQIAYVYKFENQKIAEARNKEIES